MTSFSSHTEAILDQIRNISKDYAEKKPGARETEGRDVGVSWNSGIAEALLRLAPCQVILNAGIRKSSVLTQLPGAQVCLLDIFYTLLIGKN